MQPGPIPVSVFIPVLLLCVVGIFYLLRVAMGVRERSFSIDGFFLAGRNVGAPLSEQAFWGSSFSLANGLAYFAVFGYLFGLSALWLQVPWCLSIVFIAWQLDRYLLATDRHTIHGFLGDWFGAKTRVLAAIVTITGFLGFLAYEINISSEIIMVAMGAREHPDIFVSATIALSLASILLVALFCDIAGYRGIAVTDRAENRFGLVAVLLLIVLLYFSNRFQPDSFSLANLSSSLFDFSSWNVTTALGILCYALTINLVDMSHWQTLSANTGDTSTHAQRGKLKWAIIRSAVYTFFLPGVAGAFLGYLARGVNVKNPIDAIAILINFAHLDIHPWLAGITLGVIGFGLFCTAFSTAKNYLMAGCQVLCWDILSYQSIVRLREQTLPDDENRSLVELARPLLYFLGVAAVLVFMGVRIIANNDDKVFATQFLMTGAVVSLFPATVFALFRSREKPISAFAVTSGFCSIAGGFLAALTVFSISVIGNRTMDTYAWGPIFALIVSVIAWLPVLFFWLTGKISGEEHGLDKSSLQ